MAEAGIDKQRRRNLDRYHQRAQSASHRDCARSAASVRPRASTADHARTARRRAEGKPPRDPEARRRAAGLCETCAAHATGGATYCGPCATARNERRQRNPQGASGSRPPSGARMGCV